MGKIQIMTGLIVYITEDRFYLKYGAEDIEMANILKDDCDFSIGIRLKWATIAKERPTGGYTRNDVVWRGRGLGRVNI